MKKKLDKKIYIVLVLFIVVTAISNVTWSKRAGNMIDYGRRCGLVYDGGYDQATDQVHVKTVCSESPKYDAIKKNIDKENVIITFSFIVLLGLFCASIVFGKLKGGLITVLVYIAETYLMSIFV